MKIAFFELVFLGFLVGLAGCTDRSPDTADSELQTPPDQAQSNPKSLDSPDDSGLQRIRAELEEFLANNESDLPTLLRLAALEASGDNHEEMIAYLNQGISAHPDAPQPRIVLGRYYLARGDSAKALELVEEVAWAHETNVAMLGLLGAAQFHQGKYEDARETLEQLRQLEPDNVAVHYQLARIYAELKQTELIEESLERALAIDPNHFQTRLAHARYELIRGNVAVAAEDLKVLQNLAPDHPDVQSLASSLHDSQSAGADQTEAIAAQMKYAQESLANGKVEQAIQAYRAVIDLDATNLEALNNLAWFLRDVEPDAALGYARRAAAQNPDSPLVLDTLAMVLLANQQVDESVSTIERALGLSPDEKSIQFHSAQIHLAAGDLERARVLLQELLQSGLDDAEREQAKKLLALVNAREDNQG